MVRSMTGFGRGEYIQDDRKFTIEIKSVNHRYCDINVRMPRKISFLENNVRNYIKNKLSRGKVDVYISYEDHSEKKDNIRFNEELTKEYLSHFEYISNTFNLDNDIKVSHMTRYPDVLTIEEQQDDEDVLWNILSKAIEIAITKMISTRETEGELLKKDIIYKLNNMIEELNIIKEKTPLVVEEYKLKLESRINELMDNVTIDESRLAMEVAVFADKSCIDEEIVRLESHIQHFKNTFDTNQPIGRKLDFLAQEMNREANTILSKANSINISNQAIELKTEIEKIREQIQNIE